MAWGGRGGGSFGSRTDDANAGVAMYRHIWESSGDAYRFRPYSQSHQGVEYSKLKESDKHDDKHVYLIITVVNIIMITGYSIRNFFNWSVSVWISQTIEANVITIYNEDQFMYHLQQFTNSQSFENKSQKVLTLTATFNATEVHKSYEFIILLYNMIISWKWNTSALHTNIHKMFWLLTDSMSMQSCRL